MSAFNPHRLCLPDSTGRWLVETALIVSITAADRYCQVTTTQVTKAVFCSLKQVQAWLGHSPFYRIHKSHLVNLDHVIHISAGAYCQVTLRDHRQLPVAKSKRQLLLAALPSNEIAQPQSATITLTKLHPTKTSVAK